MKTELRPSFGETVDQVGTPPETTGSLPYCVANPELLQYRQMSLDKLSDSAGPLRDDAGGLVARALIRRGLATDEPAPILTALGINEARASLNLGNSRAQDRHFTNYYRCPECGEEWEDRWSCACNDECPGCGLKDIEPVHSEDTPNAREEVG